MSESIATGRTEPALAPEMPPAVPVAAAAGQGVLAADVGGTHARLVWATRDADGVLRLQRVQRYACAEHAGLGAILADYVAGLAHAGVAGGPLPAVVAIAGVADGDAWLNANLPWPVSRARTRAEAGLASLELLNDFAALAYGIPLADPAALQPLVGQGTHRFRWPALVLGPGTGLGAALRFADGERPVLGTEVGHAALAAGNALELEVLARLLRRWPHVGNERVLSGTGLLNLYGCLCEIEGTAPCWHTPAEVVAAADRGDALAVRTVRAFCEWLGSAVGDLVVTFEARSVYLAGGVSGHLRHWLAEGGFARRFLNKGVLAPTLEQVPVWRIEHGELAVLGAAAWHLAHPGHADPGPAMQPPFPGDRP